MNLQSAKIEKIDARSVIVPLTRPVRTAVGIIPAAPLVLIDVTTSEGVTGHSYVFAYVNLALASLQRLVREIGDDLKGKPAAPHDIMSYCDRRFRLLGWQGLVGMAVSGIDMALWDAVGKGAGVSVARLLGSCERAIEAYDSYGVIDPSEDREVLAQSAAAGFRAFKIKLGDGDLAGDVAAVSAAREAIGPACRLMVDFNQSLSVPEARSRIDRLAEFDLHWVEEPVKAEDLLGHARVRRDSPVAIQTGENWWFPTGLAAAIAAGASDHAMLDIMKIGGVTGWLAAAALAQAASLPVSSHIFPEASAHVMTATPTAHMLEWLDLAGPVLVEPTRPKDGKLCAKGSGLGIVWNEPAIKRYLAS